MLAPVPRTLPDRYAPRFRARAESCTRSSGRLVPGSRPSRLARRVARANLSTAGRRCGSLSEGYLRADDYGAIGWQLEGFDWTRRVAGHRDEQPLEPKPDARTVGRRDRDPREEVLGVLEVQGLFEQAPSATERQQHWDVELLVVADPDRHMPDDELGAEPLDGEPLVVVDARDADLIDGGDEGPVVERVGVIDFGAEGQRRRLLGWVKENGDAGNPDDGRISWWGARRGTRPAVPPWRCAFG